MKKILLLTFIVLVLFCVIPTMALDIGSIKVITNPPGAHVSIDGNPQSDVTPHTFDGIPVGTHTVTLSLDSNYAIYETHTVVVTAGQTTMVESQLLEPKMTVSLGGNPYYASNGFIRIRDYALNGVSIIVNMNPWLNNWPELERVWIVSIEGEGMQYLDYEGNSGRCLGNGWTCEDPVSDVISFFSRVKDNTPVGTVLNLIIHGEYFSSESNYQRTTFDIPIQLTAIPEFPSAFLPITIIIGFLGSILLMRRK